MEFYSSEQKVLKNYLEHYGVKGMKWGRTKISKITSSDMIRKEAAKRTTSIANAALMQNASALTSNGSGGSVNSNNESDNNTTSINHPGSDISSFGNLLREKEKEREKKREIMLERLRRNADGLKNKSYKQAVSEGKQKINMVKNAIAKLFS